MKKDEGNNSYIGEEFLGEISGVFSLRKHRNASKKFLCDIISGSLVIALDYRRVREAATSPATVKRSSDSTTQNANFVGERFGIERSAAFVGGGSGYASAWIDQANGYVFSALSDGPTIINAGTQATANGRQIGQGTANAFLSYKVGIFQTIFSGSTMTMFVVCTIGNSTAGRIVSATTQSGSGDATSGAFILWQSSLGTVRLGVGATTNAIQIASIPSGLHIFTVRWNGTGTNAVSMRRNGGAWVTYSGSASTYSIGQFGLFRNVVTTSGGVSTEAITACYVYNRVLSGSEISYVEQDLAKYYGITI